MKKILFVLVLLITMSANANYQMVCFEVTNEIKRCENDEVICYIYDTLNYANGGRGAGISCIRKETK